MMKKKDKILIIAAHPDDDVIGCGATIKKYAKKGHKVNVIFLTNGEDARKENKNFSEKKTISRKKSALKASKILGTEKPVFLNFPDQKLDTVPMLDIIQKIEKYIKLYSPDVVFTHHSNDLNLDHRIAFNAVITACRPEKIKKKIINKIFSFEISCTTSWMFDNKKDKSFIPNWFEKIDQTMHFKLKALRCYRDEMKKSPHPRSIEGIKALNKWRGSISGNKYSEAFILVRSIN